MCVSADYAAPARLVVAFESDRELAALGSDSQAQSGWVQLAAGASLRVAYDLRALFPNQPLLEARLCCSVGVIVEGYVPESAERVPLLLVGAAEREEAGLDELACKCAKHQAG
jgi:hypothetical protein